MLYTSTRNNNVKVTASEAIAQGISADGGLFVPVEIPQISLEFINSLTKLSYIERAKKVLSLYLTDFTAEEIDYCVEGAYKQGKFSSPKVAPLASLNENASVLELWHGPTCAFKDMALQLLPYLLTTSAKKSAPGKTIVILVATSGDTGKAALEGFKDVEGTKIIVFYPSDGVSPMQKLQMVTQEGENVSVCAISGNFDDAQNGVKAIFTDEAIQQKLASHNMMFSSANSINWGRLVPQIVYYISAYADLIAEGKVKLGDKINIDVPTGNFGNILAAYYAKRMGLPVGKLICASNANNVLTDFINSGIYDRNRNFFTTVSPSMDILISSNLERLLYHLTDGNDKQVASWMTQLSKTGKYSVDEETKAKISNLFAAFCCDDGATKATIAKVYSSNYLCDTHTAVAINAYYDYINQTDDNTHMVIASTANPYKFSAAVCEAVDGRKSNLDEFALVDHLVQTSGVPCPSQLLGLSNKAIRFSGVINKEDMPQIICSLLNIK